MSAGARPDAETAAQLLVALERTGPRPVLAWYGEAGRIELSGHVLANWLIKSLGHLHDEIALEPGETVVLDLPAHWKRLVLALAAWALGAEVTVLVRDSADPQEEPTVPATAEEPRVVVTDRPGSELADTADEVLAVQAVSLAPRYDGELPPLVHDWLTEVRGSADQLGIALPAWAGPAPAEPTGAAAQPPRLLVDADGLPVLPQVLGALLAGGGIVGPADLVTERRAQEEGVTGRA